MSLFSRFRRGEPVPDWAVVLDRRAFDEFSGMVRGFVGTRIPGAEISFEEGVIRTVDKFELGLHNLVQTCSVLDRSEWVEAISNHFELVMEAIEKEDEDLSWEEAGWLIMPRLFGPMELGSAIVDFERVPGIATALVLDLPTVVRSVSESDVVRWGLPLEVMWDVALGNLSKRSRVEVEILDEERKLYTLSGDGTFEATHILKIDRYAQIPKHGILICIPTRDALVWKPIESRESFDQGVSELGRLARGIYFEGPASITTNLYWLVGGKLLEIAVSWEGDKMSVHLDEESRSYLAELGRKAQNLS